MKNIKIRSCRGFSVIEVVLAAAIFMLFSTAAVTVILGGFNSNRLGNEETIANQFASEGIEAVKSIKNQAYSNLNAVNPTPRAVRRNASNVWEFNTTDGSNNTLIHNSSDNYIRQVKVEAVNRDASGNIVSTGGTLDSDTKKITSSVSWKPSATRNDSVVLTTYLTDWRRPLPSNRRGGILVYGDGGTTSDAIKYKILDGNGVWSAASLAGDVDASTNRALRAARVYSSSTRNEKILLTRHFDGTKQYIYGQVFNGSSWTVPQLMSSWPANTFLDVRNFDGTYLNNGNFMAVYSDNTSIPKSKIWDGSTSTCCWLDQPPLADLANNSGGGIPTYIVTKARPGTNEVMAAFFGQLRDTDTEYYNGSTWTLQPIHANNAPVNTKELVNFVWSTNSKGALIFTTSVGETTIKIKVWDAVTGTWSSKSNSPSSSGKPGVMTTDSRKGAEEFMTCQKDDKNNIYCFRADSIPAWTSPTNNILTTASDPGIQRSFDFKYEANSGTEGIAIYADTTAPTNQARLKRYYATVNGLNPANSFDSMDTKLNALGGSVKTVKLRANPDNDDIMIMMGDGSTPPRFYTVVWDGTNNALYTVPSGEAFSTHGINGSTTTDFWYDFAWDQF